MIYKLYGQNGKGQNEIEQDRAGQNSEDRTVFCPYGFCADSFSLN